MSSEQKVSVTIRLPEDLDIRLTVESAKAGQSRSEFTEEALRSWIKAKAQERRQTA